MIERTHRDEETRVIRVDGLEIQRLRGGFLACFHDRKTPRGGMKKAGDDSVSPAGASPEGERGEGKAPGRNEPVEFLYCKKCGTLIQVTPPGRSARCCNQMMVPLREVAPGPDPEGEDADAGVP